MRVNSSSSPSHPAKLAQISNVVSQAFSETDYRKNSDVLYSHLQFWGVETLTLRNQGVPCDHYSCRIHSICLPSVFELQMIFLVDRL